jgi:hypothetical protein
MSRRREGNPGPLRKARLQRNRVDGHIADTINTPRLNHWIALVAGLWRGRGAYRQAQSCDAA